ncbi:MAG: hypothetical protein ACXW1P_09625 [Methylophilaceae bacterium]
MKSYTKTLLAISIMSIFLAACSKEDSPATPTTEVPSAVTPEPATPAATATPTPPAEAAPPSTEPGGYVQTPEERYVPEPSGSTEVK